MLPTDYKARKDIPLFDGTIGYFPLAFREMARVSMDGNAQHNPGEPLHWAREKSTDQQNTAFRHWVDHSVGVLYDGTSRHDGKPIYHLAKTFWRIGAMLQLLIEKTEATEYHAMMQMLHSGPESSVLPEGQQSSPASVIGSQSSPSPASEPARRSLVCEGPLTD